MIYIVNFLQKKYLKALNIEYMNNLHFYRNLYFLFLSIFKLFSVLTVIFKVLLIY